MKMILVLMNILSTHWKPIWKNRTLFFLVCIKTDDGTGKLAGIASARIEQKAYGFSRWLYVDEVDSCKNYRQQGVGTALMRELLRIASENKCEEVWLGTESRNVIANKFYESLKPDAIDEVIGYTFEPWSKVAAFIPQ